jgi:hypothetical protein
LQKYLESARAKLPAATEQADPQTLIKQAADLAKQVRACAGRCEQAASLSQNAAVGGRRRTNRWAHRDPYRGIWGEPREPVACPLACCRRRLLCNFSPAQLVGRCSEFVQRTLALPNAQCLGVAWV